jgi:hypothetical protein
LSVYRFSLSVYRFSLSVYRIIMVECVAVRRAKFLAAETAEGRRVRSFFLKDGSLNLK